MIRAGKIQNKFLLSMLSTALLGIIGYIDWHTGYEFTLSVFYLLPVALLAFYKGVTKVQLVINSLLAAAIWYVTDINTGRQYSHFLFPLWEAIAVFATFLVVSLLIYRLKREHKKLIETNAALRQLNEEKNMFLGIAAHDLRSPIGAILGFSELLRADSMHDPEEFNEIMGIIHQSAEKSLNLLSSLLNVSRIESGIVNITPQTLNYIEFVKQIIATNQLLASKKSQFIDFDSELDEVLAHIDPLYFDEVLTNLLTNAIKYSHPNTRIKVSIEVLNGRILTKVSDRGVGISESEIDSLFQPFQRSSSKPTQGESSTGLGLAIVKKIVLLHNGEIGINSKINHGTTVFFYIPQQKGNMRFLFNKIA